MTEHSRVFVHVANAGGQHRLIVRVTTNVTIARDSIVLGIAAIRDSKVQYAKVPMRGDFALIWTGNIRE